MVYCRGRREREVHRVYEVLWVKKKARWEPEQRKSTRKWGKDEDERRRMYQLRGYFCNEDLSKCGDQQRRGKSGLSCRGGSEEWMQTVVQKSKRKISTLYYYRAQIRFSYLTYVPALHRETPMRPPHLEGSDSKVLIWIKNLRNEDWDKTVFYENMFVFLFPVWGISRVACI